MSGPLAHKGRLLGGVVAGLLLIAGVSAASSPAKTDHAAKPQAKQAVTTVTLAHWASSPVETAALNRVIANFHRTHRNIRINRIVLDPYPEGMLARFAARRAPDIFYVDSNVFPDWQKQRLLEPLNDDMVRAKFSPKPFYQRLLAAFRTSNGTIYGFPKDWSPLGMEVNTTMLRAAGVTAPRTWAQLRTAGQRLRAAGQPPICLGVGWDRLLAFVYQNRGGFLNAAKTRAIVNTAATREAVTYYLGLLTSGVARTPAQLGAGWCGEALGQQKASIIFEGNWVIGYMREQFPNVNWQLHRMVRGKQEANLGFTVSYSIARQSTKKRQAFTVLTYLVGQRGMRLWTQQGIALPSRRGVTVPSGRGPLITAAPHARPWQFAPGFARVIDTANNELQAAFEGKQTISTALQKIQAAANAQLARNR